MADAVGNRLKRLRDLAGVPQAAVAAYMGFDRAFLSMVESGYRSVSPQDADKIERFLQLEQSKKVTEFASVRLDAVTA